MRASDDRGALLVVSPPAQRAALSHPARFVGAVHRPPRPQSHAFDHERHRAPSIVVVERDAFEAGASRVAMVLGRCPPNGLEDRDAP
ncbi:MAG TPA: hypothetical protein VJT72_08370, partial [Pseudonocardiaceae bacterium]|nr:hypothetical protein [Pseudonocardiaceae bacterium]